MSGAGWRRLWLGTAGLLGAVGVCLAAAAAHLAASADAPNLRLAADFTIFHALALLGVAALTRGGEVMLRLAGALFLFGALAFGGGLALTVVIGQGVAPLVPIGGTALILGWLALVLAALFDRKPPT